MNVIIHEGADAELAAAAEWYEQEREGLGGDLLAEAGRVLNAIAESPSIWPFVSGSRVVQSFLFPQFPYVVYFVVQNEAVLVMAFGHTSRRPGYWRSRLNK